MRCSHKRILMCGEQATYGSFCERHANKCGVCGKPTGWLFCTLHECMSEQCHEQIKINAKYCDTHSCVLCSAKSLQNQRYCSGHVCDFFRCDEEILTGSRHCQFHTCRRTLMQKEIKQKKEGGKNQTIIKPVSTRLRPNVNPQPTTVKLESIDEMTYGAMGHNDTVKQTMYDDTITRDGTICENPVHNDDIFCILHMCKFCVKDDTIRGHCDRHSCIECKAPTPIIDRYCDIHACTYERECTNVKTKGSKYCVNHKCQTCSEPTVKNSKFCTVHICAYERCNNVSDTYSDYCTNHKCASCNNIVYANGKFCSSHKCAVSDCNKEQTEQCKWCMTHACHACDNFANRVFIDKPACDAHFGMCVDCHVKPTAKLMSRCMPCHKTYEIVESLADATAKMTDATRKLRVVETELEETKKTASYGKDAIEKIDTLRTVTAKSLAKAQEMITHTAHEAETARKIADIAAEHVDKANEMINDINVKTDDLNTRVESTEDVLDEIKSKRRR